jgi:Fe-S-cluster containining protein
VTVNDAEIVALARRLELSEDEFREGYTRHMPNGTISLREKANYDCVFWAGEQGCLVYEERPSQCRNWPFWRTNVRQRQCWDNSAKNCPGMNHGRLYTLEEIEERAGTTP